MVRGEGTGWSEVQAQQALGYITALLGNASYHAGVGFGSKGRDFALRTGRGPDIWLDKSSSVYQTGKEKRKGARGEELRKGRLREDGSSQATERALLVGTANQSIGRSALDNTASCPLHKPQTYHTSHQTALRQLKLWVTTKPNGNWRKVFTTGKQHDRGKNWSETLFSPQPPSKQLGSLNPQIYHL